MEIHKHFPVIKINANGQKPPVKRQDFLDCIFFNSFYAIYKKHLNMKVLTIYNNQDMEAT